MFGLGLHPAFLIVLFIIVLIVFGPGKLPEMAGAAGRMVREFRRASDDVTGEIRRALDLPEGQGNSNLFSAQGLIDQLTREQEVPTATEVEGTAESEELDPESVGAVDPIGSFGPPEIDAGVYASSNDGSPVERSPFEEATSAGHHEPSSAVMAPPEEVSAVDQELAKDPDPVDEVEETDEPAIEPPADVTEAPQPSASVEEPGASPEEASPQPPAATVENPPEPEGDGGEKTGEGTA
ncbi:MAG TPA: twin-arginine translocase TatA/TatE family subunit [Candidatus Dormibacteraeota bacterium]|nr:twin-arginine translocase TatA/TatE family subunit [Candidatus Dormibacteraeota bacterium]